MNAFVDLFSPVNVNSLQINLKNAFFINFFQRGFLDYSKRRYLFDIQTY